MHGAGNDFVMLNGMGAQLPDNLGEFSQVICHRRFGVGADQVLIAYPSDQADFRMDIYNADGGRVEMCGNGIRAFAKYVQDLKLTAKDELTIETLAGLIKPQIIKNHPKAKDDTVWVKVDMGEPVLEGDKIPVKKSGRVVDYEFELSKKGTGDRGQGSTYKITCVSMGNPHCVIFVDDVNRFPVTTVGPEIEMDPFFPNRVNVEFVQVDRKNKLIQRTWERGSGETYACGTGAAAVCVAGVLNGLIEREVTISLRGGDLDLLWDESSNHVFKTGPATEVFQGEFEY